MATLMLQMRALLCVTILYHVNSVTGFQTPTSFADIATLSTITTTKNCAKDFSGTSCNSTCPTRTAFPDQGEYPFRSIESECSTITDGTSSLPDHVTKDGVEFNAQTNECSTITHNYSNIKFFTISMWIKVICSSCDILTNGQNLHANSNTLQWNGDSVSINTDNWHSVVIRYSSSLDWFINGTRKTKISSQTESSLSQITFGPDKNLTETDSIMIVDFRLYLDALTDREIESLFTGQPIHDLPMDSDCRCPRTHPALVKHTFPKEYMKCSNGVEQISRFNQDAKFPEFLNDNDTTTSWNSGPTSTVNITIALTKSFQLHQLTLDGITREPDEMNIVVYNKDTQVNVITFRQTCSSDNNCIPYQQSLFQFSYTFDTFLDPTSTITREKYESIVADKVEVVIKTKGSKEFFNSNDIKLYVRCHCYGNDDTCTVSDGDFTCNCAGSTYTAGDNCQTCADSYYREKSHLNCNIPCACNEVGSSDTTCKELGGQCTCKNNVMGRKCDSCIHNAANLSSNGCTACSCNSDGITSCTDGLICNCKKNVETSTRECQSCLLNFYGIRNKEGCLPCDCFRVGTEVSALSTCDATSGQCQCKALVEGRKCDKCKPESYDLSESNALTGCKKCGCNFVGSKDMNCNSSTGECNCRIDRVPGVSQRNCAPTNLMLKPTYGPMAGSTLLTISGHDLGEDVDMSFNIAGVPQTVIARNDTQIIIKTNSSSLEGQRLIRLYWVDSSNGISEYVPEEFNREFKFEYRNDPIIQLASQTQQKSYASGGCTLRFEGKNLNSVAHPKLLIQPSTKVIESPCRGKPAHLSCLTPNMTEYAAGTLLTYGFYLDGITIYRNVSTVMIVDDPKITNGNEEDFRVSFDDVFRITGKNLNLACPDVDVAILFDDEVCRLLSRTNDSISCDPEEKFPGETRTVEVKVKIGDWVTVWGQLNIRSFWNTNEFIYIATGICAFIVLVIALVVFFCMRKYRRRNRNQSDFQELTEHPFKSSDNQYEFNPVAIMNPTDVDSRTKRTSAELIADFFSRLDPKTKKIVKASEVDRSHIEIGNVCTNKGSLIRVVNGTYKLESSSPHSNSKLTIKTLVKPYSEEGKLPDWLNKGLLESTRLQDFNNENVIRMMGISVDTKNVYILYPEMSKRTLKDFLSNASESHDNDLKMNMCLQTAMGMNYLSAEGITHKDLAARNCWVTADEIVKVGDASFAYDLYPKEYCTIGDRHQPVRWMAPECLKQGFYDLKTDVWAFGVVVWEVFTNGYLPFHDITNDEDVKKKVSMEHYRLGIPHDCPEKMFGVIEQCHLDVIDDRPNFYLLVNVIENIINPDPQGTVNYVNDPTEDAIYTNVAQPPPRPPKGNRLR